MATSLVTLSDDVLCRIVDAVVQQTNTCHHRHRAALTLAQCCRRLFFVVVRLLPDLWKDPSAMVSPAAFRGLLTFVSRRVTQGFVWILRTPWLTDAEDFDCLRVFLCVHGKWLRRLDLRTSGLRPRHLQMLRAALYAADMPDLRDLRIGFVVDLCADIDDALPVLLVPLLPLLPALCTLTLESRDGTTDAIAACLACPQPALTQVTIRVGGYFRRRDGACSLLPGLARQPGLKEVRFGGGSSPDDAANFFDGAVGAEAVRSLDVDLGHAPSSYDFLCNFPGLAELHLSTTSAPLGPAVATMTHIPHGLTSLSLQRVALEPDARALTPLTALREMYLLDVGGLECLRGLSPLRRLKTLHLVHPLSPLSLEGIGGCTSLETFVCSPHTLLSAGDLHRLRRLKSVGVTVNCLTSCELPWDNHAFTSSIAVWEVDTWTCAGLSMDHLGAFPALRHLVIRGRGRRGGAWILTSCAATSTALQSLDWGNFDPGVEFGVRWPNAAQLLVAMMLADAGGHSDETDADDDADAETEVADTDTDDVM